jgi:hypothetical protein
MKIDEEIFVVLLSKHIFHSNCINENLLCLLCRRNNIMDEKRGIVFGRVVKFTINIQFFPCKIK